jgi:hypothetical protein
VNVSVAVQHHPARAHLIDRLVERLGGAEVVTDPDPDGVRSPYRTYVEALRRTPPGATHRLIVQDDAEPADGFRPRMLDAVATHPDRLVALFVPGSPPHRAAVLRAQKAGQSWVTLPPTWVPTVALCWPVEMVALFLAWADTKYPDGTKRMGDDGPVGKWAQTIRTRAVAPIPSLVQHPDVEPSLIGRRAAGGANRARVAVAFDEGA